MNRICICICALVLSLGAVYGQDYLPNVHLFQNFFRDATIATSPYAEGGLMYDDIGDNASSFSILARGGYPVNPNLEVNSGIAYTSNSFKAYGKDVSESGIEDIPVYGRYKFDTDKVLVTAGGFITLPIGSDKVLQTAFGNGVGGTFNFGAFGAMRYALENSMIITGTVGLDFMKAYKDADRETALDLGAGLIYPQSKSLNIIGEFRLLSKGDYTLLSGGVDYKLQGEGHVRGFIGLGLDDGAPDLSIGATYLIAF
jgi:hypothetical protein